MTAVRLLQIITKNNSGVDMRKLSVPEWCCAVRFNKDDGTSILNDTKSEFTVLKNSYRYWIADPFLAEENGRYYLFFEAYDRLKRKGVLGCREISENHMGKIKIIYECPFHLSYPFIFKENGEYYIVPESKAGGELFRLKCEHFPDKWIKEKVIMNENIVDTTIFNHNGTDYYISERVIKAGVFDRVDIFYEKDGCIFDCSNNPVKRDAESARGAGALFKYGGRLIRPSQNCGRQYGDKLNFNEVLRLDENGFEEKVYKTVSAEDICLNVKNNFTGIHTYNRLDNIEVIDLKIGANFNLLNIIGAVMKRLFKRQDKV